MFASRCCGVFVLPDCNSGNSAAAAATAGRGSGNGAEIWLWLDEAVSTPFSPDRSLEFEFHQRLDDGASNLFEYFFQGGMAFGLRPGLTRIPIYRYQRYPGDVITPYENRLLLKVTLTTKRGGGSPSYARLPRGDFQTIASNLRGFEFVLVSSMPCRFE